MRAHYLPLVSLFLSLAIIAPADNLRRVAEANERAFAEALKTKNGKWFETVAAPDYYQINMAGVKTNRKAAITEMKQMFGMGRVTKMSTKISRVTPKGRGMTVLVDAHIVIRGKPEGTTKISTMDATTRYEETWSKDNGKWRIHCLKTLSNLMRVDGKAIPNG